ncbi:6-carboxyhexanoate--CoA ligase [Halalkalibacter krulwichiae]|uniref:6-carboxyhexanoate--CoA ligase n=1 Tax=Halalkalibacter krulwichiae TaxID=199441 RepID=A0A1X9M5Y2_9BACI|nr:6-carboxyhexanoate--CoA ligase [Halalkalibacter krulwichiae]ARK28858.1 6-carboxyhexanoate--CoA ligase [Halalkalibacter krulwichiae]
MQADRYTIRMRAAKGGPHENGGKHISGGEALVKEEEIKRVVHTMLDKALDHSRGKPDFLQVTVEEVVEPIDYLKPLPIHSHQVNSLQEGQGKAINLLELCGIPTSTIEKAYRVIANPLNRGLRGAMFIDIDTGQRVDRRGEKGVRVSRMDWNEENFILWATRKKINKSLRIKEAVTLATKVANCPEVMAELCWSDDPDYLTGYVSSIKIGYQRISKLKKFGDESGCRIFFVRACDVTSCIDYLENRPTLLLWEEENDEQLN